MENGFALSCAGRSGVRVAGWAPPSLFALGAPTQPCASLCVALVPGFCSVHLSVCVAGFLLLPLVSLWALARSVWRPTVALSMISYQVRQNEQTRRGGFLHLIV